MACESLVERMHDAWRMCLGRGKLYRVWKVADDHTTPRRTSMPPGNGISLPTGDGSTVVKHAFQSLPLSTSVSAAQWHFGSYGVPLPERHRIVSMHEEYSSRFDGAFIPSFPI